MAYVLKLRPEAGTVPWGEVNLLTRLMSSPVIMDPQDFDARSRDQYGRLTRARRAIMRRMSFPDLMALSDADVELLHRWKHERVRVAISPNWNDRTALYARFARARAGTSLPGAIIGPQPTFARTVSNGSASATYFGADGRFHALAANAARFEEASASNAWRRYAGLRPYGRHQNYFQPSHPTSAALQWSLTSPSNGNLSGNASWAWNANLESMYADLPVSAGGTSIGLGVGLFAGDSGDFVQLLPSSYGGAGTVSICVWVRGEGTVSLKATGAVAAETANTVISPTVWTALKLENLTMSGSALTLQLFSRATKTWCAVSAMQMIRAPRVFGYLYNSSASSAILDHDSTYFDFQAPHFGCAIHLGLEMPDLYASGEQAILGIDHGGGNRFVVYYNGATNRWVFQWKTSGDKITFVPARTAGQATILSLVATKDSYYAYENGAAATPVARNITATVPRGLYLGWDGVTNTNGYNGLIHWLRVDNAVLDTAEISYINSLYNDTQQVNYTRLFEGRLFEIATPVHQIRAGYNRASLELEEVTSYRHATTEAP